MKKTNSDIKIKESEESKSSAKKLEKAKISHFSTNRPLSFLRRSLEKSKQCLSQL